MLPRRKNIQSLFGGAISGYSDNERMYNILVLWKLNIIITGRAMFQSRNFNTRLENAFEILLLRQIVSIDTTISSMVETFILPLIISFLFNLLLVFL